MRIRMVMIICVFTVSGCVPILLSQKSTTTEFLFRVPAKPGLTVSVPVGNKSSSVWYRAEPVPCVARTDGTVDFKIRQTNRHSPFLVYELGPADLRPCKPALGNVSKNAFKATVKRTSTPQIPAVHRSTDMVIVAPRQWLGAITPLAKHRRHQKHVVQVVAAEDIYAIRSGHNPDPVAIRDAITQAYLWTGGSLQYVLLVGDIQAQYDALLEHPTPIPAFYGDKLAYPGVATDHEFPTDHPYSVVKGVSRMAVGRLPARTKTELKQMVAKIINYETKPQFGHWQRRLMLMGGPANFSPFIDKLIENEATHLIDQKVPYDFDVDVTFANPGSPYAYRLDRLGSHLVRNLNRGALFAAYVGHGLPTAFDEVSFRGRDYEIGTSKHMTSLSIPNGKPVMLSLTCHTGAYDLPKGEPSLAEQMMLNPNGPVAVFASSRESHPYTNALYARGFIDHFLRKRPDTLGLGMRSLKKSMLHGRHLLAETFLENNAGALRREHLGLYNLFGDPAMRIRYPAAVDITSDAAPDHITVPGQALKLEIQSPQIKSGLVTLTLETDRKTIRGDTSTRKQLETMPLKSAFNTMVQQRQMALDKVIQTVDLSMNSGRANACIEAPQKPGRYYVKALVTGKSDAAAGHYAFTVIKPRQR